METIIRDKVVIFLQENIMINNFQQGFRNNHCCFTNLQNFYNDVFNFYDEANAVDVIYLDL